MAKEMTQKTVLYMKLDYDGGGIASRNLIKYRVMLGSYLVDGITTITNVSR